MAFAHDTEAKELFWKSVEARAMELPYCTACKRFFFYPRPLCPNCWPNEVELRPASGNGAIFTYSIVRSPHGNITGWHQRIPYVVALIETDEHVRVVTNLVEVEPDEVEVGMRVEAVFDDRGGGSVVPQFRPSR